MEWVVRGGFEVTDTRFSDVEGDLKTALSSLGAYTKRSKLCMELVCCSKGADRFCGLKSRGMALSTCDRLDGGIDGY